MKQKTGAQSLTFEQQTSGSLLAGSNSAWLESLYESWQQDPESVAEKWRAYFTQLADAQDLVEHVHYNHSEVRRHFLQLGRTSGLKSSRYNYQKLQKKEKQTRVLQLINAYRFTGHLSAQINPIFSVENTVAELSLEYHQLDEGDLETVFSTGSLVAPAEMTLAEIVTLLQHTYCGSIGVEYMYINDTEEKRWIQQRFESVRSQPNFTDQQRRYILERLTSAETLERFLHTRYVGQKRFSLEGGESLIPLLDALIQAAGSMGVNEVVLGMAHRGRLNVLVNILGKSPAVLFSEFEGKKKHGNRTGDVKYHMGFSSDMNTPGGPVHLALGFNPSHLEIVGPVVEGAARARQDRKNDKDGSQVIPVVIHGDAAVAGQGVVMETLNMSNTRWFSTHGTVRIVINNQIGFTTSVSSDSRSTHYCTDIAKMVDAPVFHVNGDDPEAVVFTVRRALEYRKAFKKDVFIDLVCYRRHGHNEADEPAITQPVMYGSIRALPSTRTLYARKLQEQGVITEAKADDMVNHIRALLENGEPVVPHLIKDSEDTSLFVDWSAYQRRRWDTKVKTSISEKRINKLSATMNLIPKGYPAHPRVRKIYDQRLLMGSGEVSMDWGFCEMLAYAALVQDGYDIRLCGQDSRRGTFSHRHSTVHNQDDRSAYVPLSNMASGQAKFTVIDSLLSEVAVLGFEYGYSTTEPEKLVIWEAQFGDFANGAQVVIDQFISSGEQKWGRLSGLTMYLPHGFEGQGPEHSSARIERYLQLCAQQNMQIVVPSTPAQMFHLIRRQMIRKYRKPLIVFTPKSLLRHPLAVNEMNDISHAEFFPALAEADEQNKDKVDRIILCSGKIYYDLIERRRAVAKKQQSVAILRLEQLYPFPEKQLRNLIDEYANVKTLIWCQEEPLNQGAWDSIKHRFKSYLDYLTLHAVTRPPAAAPAVGNMKTHRDQQKSLVETALWQTEWTKINGH